LFATTVILQLKFATPPVCACEFDGVHVIEFTFGVSVIGVDVSFGTV
jgi:hypothetical protein